MNVEVQNSIAIAHQVVYPFDPFAAAPDPALRRIPQYREYGGDFS